MMCPDSTQPDDPEWLARAPDTTHADDLDGGFQFVSRRGKAGSPALDTRSPKQFANWFWLGLATGIAISFTSWLLGALVWLAQ